MDSVGWILGLEGLSLNTIGCCFEIFSLNTNQESRVWRVTALWDSTPNEVGGRTQYGDSKTFLLHLAILFSMVRKIMFISPLCLS